jgi:hypothetical protein
MSLLIWPDARKKEMPGRFGERTRRGNMSMANLITLPPKSTEEVTVEPDRDNAAQFDPNSSGGT